MKIAICTPVYGDTRAQFTDSLAQLLIHSGRRHDLSYLTFMSSDLAGNRERLAEAALAQGADWLLWIDSDQTFPPDALERLLASGHEVVGCNYARRAFPSGPTARQFRGGAWQPLFTDAANAAKGLTEPVHLLGLGLCLVRADVMRRIERPWFRLLPPQGEDAYFFEKLHRAGVPVFVDHGLSWAIGHVGQHIFTNADTLGPGGP